MGHEHNHNTEAIGDKRLIAAIGVNAALTLAQIVGGIPLVAYHHCRRAT